MRTRPGSVPGAARGADRLRPRHRARGRLPQRRHRGVPARSRHRPLPLHRSEPPHPGRAHGHRAGHRGGPGARPDPNRRGSAHRRRSRCGLPAAERHRTARPCGAVPNHDRGPARSLHSRLWPHHRLPGRDRFRHPSRRRHCLHGSGHHPALRLAAGEGHRMGAFEGGCHRPNAARAPGVPDPRGRDQHRIPRAARGRRGVPARAGHHPLHRRQPEAARIHPPPRPGQPAPSLYRRDHRQRASGGNGSTAAACARSQSAPARPAARCIRPRSQGTARRRGALRGGGLDAEPDARPRHRHHHAGRPAVASRDQNAYPRHGAGRRGLRAQSPRSVFARMLGRRDVRRGTEVPRRVPLGPAPAPSRGHPEHPAPDAAAGLERGRLHQLSRQRRPGVRGPGRGFGRRPLPHLRPPELGREHAGRGRCGAGDGADLRGGHLLHGRSARSRTQPVRPQLLPPHGPRAP